jgi:hypothetical protein
MWFAMLYGFGFDRLGVVVGDLYWDPDTSKGQESAERGVRLELRVFRRGEPPRSIAAARPIEVGEPIWRVDLLESVAGEPGSLNRTHHHPAFTGWDPGPRVFAQDLSADPFGWLADKLAELPAVLSQAGLPEGTASSADADSLRKAAPEIVGTVRRLLDGVRGGELGQPPDVVSSAYIREGWL